MNQLPIEMDQFPNSSDMSRILTLLINILFIVIIAASFALYGNYLFRPFASPVIFVGLLTVYFMVIMHWIDYHSHITEYPYKDSMFAKARFGVQMALVAMCAYLLYSLGTAKATPDLSPYLWGFPIILGLYMASRRLKQKEYEPGGEEHQTVEETIKAQAISEHAVIEENFLLTCLCGSITICLIYQFIALPAIFSSHGGLNWLFIWIPPLVSIAYKHQRMGRP